MKKLVLIIVFVGSITSIYSQEYLLRNTIFGITPEELMINLDRTYEVTNLRYTGVFYRALWQMFSDISTSRVTTPLVYFRDNTIKIIHFSERDDENREWSNIFYFFLIVGENYRLFMIEKESNNYSSNARTLMEIRGQALTNILKVNTTIKSTIYQSLNGNTQNALICSWQNNENFYVLATNNTHSYFLIFSINLWREYSKFVKE
jgi:hypothetical protein